MPLPLSVDLRTGVVAAISGGAYCHQAAARFGVSVASASRWSARHQQEGHVTTVRLRMLVAEDQRQLARSPAEVQRKLPLRLRPFE